MLCLRDIGSTKLLYFTDELALIRIGSYNSILDILFFLQKSKIKKYKNIVCTRKDTATKLTTNHQTNTNTYFTYFISYSTRIVEKNQL